MSCLMIQPWRHNHNSCRNGRRLHEDSIRHRYDVSAPDEPTHELVVHKGLGSLSFETLPDSFGSDHMPVLAIVAGQLTIARRPPTRRIICWAKFQA